MTSPSVAHSHLSALPIAPPPRGFLPEQDPATRLPKAFSAWDELGAELPKLLAIGQARARIASLPMLDPLELSAPGDVDRALLLLSMFASGSVFENWRDQPQTTIPRSVAIPLARLAHRQGRPPILAYASYILSNWHRLDANKPLAIDNLAVNQNFLGGMDEDWFILSHIQIEVKAAPLVPLVAAAQRDILETNPSALAEHLGALAAVEAELSVHLRKLADNCDPFIFFHRIRPFLDGYQQHPVVFEGVDELRNEPQRLLGASGAQSTIFPLLDAALAVKHEEDALYFFLRELRRYMPQSHVRWLESVEHAPPLRDFVLAHRHDCPVLVERYNEAILQLDNFRTAHLEFAAIYVQGQTARRTVEARGTGGTPFMRYLKKHRDETRACLIE